MAQPGSRACFGSRRSEVRILSPRPGFWKPPITLIVGSFTKSRYSRCSAAQGSVVAARRLICGGGRPEQRISRSNYFRGPPGEFLPASRFLIVEGPQNRGTRAAVPCEGSTSRPSAASLRGIFRPFTGEKWARQDSNLQPNRYERSALTIELQAHQHPDSARRPPKSNPFGFPGQPCQHAQ